MSVTRIVPISDKEHPLSQIAELWRKYPQNSWFLIHETVVQRLCEYADDIPFVLRPEEFIVLRFDESDEYSATNMQLVRLPLVGNWFADKNNYHNIEIVGMKNSFTLPEYVFLLIDKKFEKQHRV